MPNKNYDYTLSVDFAVNNTYDPDKFKDELIALNLTSANFLHIDRKGDIVSVWYDGDLSAPDITSLTVIFHVSNGFCPPKILVTELYNGFNKHPLQFKLTLLTFIFNPSSLIITSTLSNE